MIDRRLVDELVAAVAAELAPRIAAELASGGPSADAGGPWRLLSLGEVCERLGRSERQVRGWVKSGELPHVRLDGGDLRFDLEDVRAFARARTINAGAPEKLAACWPGVREPASGAGSQGGVRPLTGGFDG